MKKILSALLAFALLCSLSGCALLSYEDTNGDDDFTLQTLTDEDLIEGTNGLSSLMSSRTVLKNTITYKCQNLSGIYTVCTKEPKNGTLELTVSCTVKKGNARLVLTSDSEILHDFEVNAADQHLVLDNLKGEVYLRFAGESAEDVVVIAS